MRRMKDACCFMNGSSKQSKVALMSERFNPPFVDYLYFLYVASYHSGSFVIVLVVKNVF